VPYLLDTNVVSEAIKARPAPRVVAWLAEQAEGTVYLSVLTVGEVEQGIVRSPNPERAARLGRWVIEELVPQFRGRLLPVDAEVMKAWGSITGRAILQGHTVGVIDSMLAATAIVHGLTLATRNPKDVAMLPVYTLNPWDEAGR